MADVRRTYHSGFVLTKTFRPMLNLTHARGPAKVKQNYYISIFNTLSAHSKSPRHSLWSNFMYLIYSCRTGVTVNAN